MSKENILKILFIIGLLISISGFFIWHNLDVASSQKTISIRGHVFKTEIVTTDSDKQKGLGGRKGLCVDCGMLFVFDEPGKYSFWMKDMRFALDLLWIRDDKIVFIEKNVAPNFSGTMNPPTDANRVLELNAGAVDKFGITVGDSVSIKN